MMHRVQVLGRIIVPVHGLGMEFWEQGRDGLRVNKAEREKSCTDKTDKKRDIYRAREGESKRERGRTRNEKGMGTSGQQSRYQEQR